MIFAIGLVVGVILGITFLEMCKPKKPVEAVKPNEEKKKASIVDCVEKVTVLESKKEFCYSYLVTVTQSDGSKTEVMVSDEVVEDGNTPRLDRDFYANLYWIPGYKSRYINKVQHQLSLPGMSGPFTCIDGSTVTFFPGTILKVTYTKIEGSEVEVETYTHKIEMVSPGEAK